MTKLKYQTDAQIEKTRLAKPEFMKKIDELMAQARDFEKGKNALSVGQIAPNFELPNANQEPISLASLLKKGPVVVTFYRGSWCPYCNLQLKALHSKLADIQAAGAELVAISPQMPDDSLRQTDIMELDFHVLSDQDARVATQYGIAWEVPALILEHMRKDRGLDLATINNGNGSILPIPATFILTADGIIKWQYVDIDYRTRAEPDDIIAALNKNE